MSEKMMRGAFLFVAVVFLVLQISGFLTRPAESARSYQYKVVSVSGMTELRTQSDADQNRRAAIENTINQQVAAGWEFVQADGYVLYFRR
ncbi:MAG TPA: hypothetical protein VLR94_04065 [Acidobacteriota bacterium]|nr:hypothetical protein [Acidobacteriota bacterium]